MKIELYLLRRYSGLLAFLVVLSVLVAGAVFAAVEDRAELNLSPWALAGPVVVFAALWSVRRTEALGEGRALAMSAQPLWLHALPIVGLALVFQILVAGFEVASSDRALRVRAEAAVVVGVGGELLIRRGENGVLYGADGKLSIVELASSGLPKGLYPQPERRAKLRRWLFFAHSPLWAGEHPLDPWLLRWLYLLGNAVVVLMVEARCGGRRTLLALFGYGLLVLLL